MAARRTDTDMTKGNPMSIIFKFTLMLLLGNVAQQLYNIVDTIIVGRTVDPLALAAVGSTGTIMFLMFGTSNGMVSGFSIVTSQRYGAGDLKGVRQSVTNGLYLSLIIAALITIVGLAFMRPLLVLMNTPEEIFDYALTYISTICAGIVCVIMYNFCASLMRAVGNSLMPLIFLICSAATNIGLDIWFIVGFRMGTFGAALATVVSQGLAVIPCVIFIYTKMPTLRPSKEDWKWNSAIIKEELKYGIPMAIQYGITASGTVIMQSAFNTFDYIAVGAITAASKFQGIITMGMFSVGQTMAAYAGQNYGAKNLTRIKQGVKAALKLYIVYSAVAAVISIIAVPKILWIFFDSDVDISLYIPWAMPYVIECAVCYFFLAMIFIYRHTIQSVGYAQLAMILGFVELGARIITSFCSIKLHNYYIAVASDPFAWVLAGVCGLFISVVIFKKIKKRWAEEKSPAQVQNDN
ncbi:putative MATE family efflux protein [Ruminococcaceae bacterium R-25]|nr:putative MATE family efflux protein [Ruminococcaceae bacterium R-25]SUQ21444.1 putative efflux protein, MATE family [Oscillospiraceae bacterium]